MAILQRLLAAALAALHCPPGEWGMACTHSKALVIAVTILAALAAIACGIAFALRRLGRLEGRHMRRLEIVAGTLGGMAGLVTTFQSDVAERFYLAPLGMIVGALGFILGADALRRRAGRERP